MKKYYTIEMENGDIYGIPAEIIAKNYADYYAANGENYDENFSAMMEWFDTDNYEFADWAKNNMNWDDVKNVAVLLDTKRIIPNFQNSWVNGCYKYVTVDEGK